MTRERSPPRVVLRYALYDKIASGGMATVHLGRLLGPVGFARTVAIKRLHSQFAEDPEFVSMFLDEARLVARISHPNVVPTLDVVSTEGELFLVMEYIHGESLARLARATQKLGKRVPPEMVVTLMVGVLHGLHAAHEARSERGEPLGIVHRDVSPQNILVGVDGAARVLDFGVAKAMGRAQTTKEGQLKGKLSYMAPEQVYGKATRATDVYAASIVLWELLTGKRLFEGENEGQVFEQVIKGCQAPPSSVVPGVSAALDAATMRGLNIDPKKRFATAREMARALEDAVPHVAPSKIGEWVESMMKEKLSERSDQIASIESDSAMAAPAARPPNSDPPTQPDDPPQKQASADAPSEARAQRFDSIPVSTQMSNGSVSAPFPSSPVPLQPQGSRFVATAVLSAVAVTLLVTLLVYRSGESRTSAASTQTTPAAVANTAVPSEAPEPTSAASVPVAPTTASAPASAESAAVASAHPAPPPVRRPQAPPTTTPGPAAGASHCNPPWYVDGRGVRVFKKECL